MPNSHWAKQPAEHFLLERFRDYLRKHHIVPVVRNADVKFRKPATGRIVANAAIDEDIAEKTLNQLDSQGRAVLTVRVQVQDENEATTMTANYEWFIQRVDI